MTNRILVTLAMVGTGYLVFQHAGVIDRARLYVAAVRSGTEPTGPAAFEITPTAAKWLAAWLALFALLLAAVDASEGAGRLAALFSLVVFVSAAYQLVPTQSTKKEA